MIIKYRKRTIRENYSVANPYSICVEFQYLWEGKWRSVHQIIRYGDEDTMLRQLADKRYVENRVAEAMGAAVRNDLSDREKNAERLQWYREMKINLKSFDKEGQIEVED